MSVNKIAVIGAGQMGSGIAQVFAAQNYKVKLSDLSIAALKGAVDNITGSCDRLIKKQAMTAEQKVVLLGNIQITTELSDVSDCNFAVEAVSENLNVKIDIIKKVKFLTQCAIIGRQDIIIPPLNSPVIKLIKGMGRTWF